MIVFIYFHSYDIDVDGKRLLKGEKLGNFDCKSEKVWQNNLGGKRLLRAGVHKNQTFSGKLHNFKIAQTLAVSYP